MPLFIDMHEAPFQASAERLAEQHERDIRVGQKFGVRWISYNNDVVSIQGTDGPEIRYRTFCIAEALSAEAVQACHLTAHSHKANEVRLLDGSLADDLLKARIPIDAPQLWGKAVKAVAGSGFTRRQEEVMGLIAQGLTNYQIAEELGISSHTVARHVADIFERAGFSNRAEAAARAQSLGIV